MLYISDQSWQTLDCDFLVVPCDASGTLNRGLVLEVANTYNLAIASQYKELCRFHKGTQSIIDHQRTFYLKDNTPTFIGYFPVAMMYEKPSVHMFWKSLRNLKDFLATVAVDGLAFPLCFTNDITEEDQLEMLHAQLDDFTRGNIYNITVYRYSAEMIIPLESELVTEV